MYFDFFVNMGFFGKVKNIGIGIEVFYCIFDSVFQLVFFDVYWKICDIKIDIKILSFFVIFFFVCLVGIFWIEKVFCNEL